MMINTFILNYNYTLFTPLNSTWNMQFVPFLIDIFISSCHSIKYYLLLDWKWLKVDLIYVRMCLYENEICKWTYLTSFNGRSLSHQRILAGGLEPHVRHVI